jgi:hypothetical protein
MTYTTEPAPGQQLTIESRHGQTAVAFKSSTPGQQQSRRVEFSTGEWLRPPALFQTPEGLVLRIEAARGPFFVALRPDGMHLLNAAPSLDGAAERPLREETSGAAPPEGMPPMEPLKPLPPIEMRMGNMVMRAGDMTMSMGEPAPAAARFCTQCGRAAADGDRFCAGCGHALRTAGGE